MLKTGYCEPARLVTPARIDKAFSDAVENGEYKAFLQPYDAWWDYPCNDHAAIGQLPLGVMGWFFDLPPEIKARSCEYISQFALELMEVRTHTRRGKAYQSPFWRSSRLISGTLSMNNLPGQKFHAKVQMTTGEVYHLGEFVARRAYMERPNARELTAAMIYDPRRSTERLYWTSAELLQSETDPAIVPLDDREASVYFLDHVNDSILPDLHMLNVCTGNHEQLLRDIKTKRTTVFKIFRMLFETCHMRHKLLDYLPQISAFQVTAIARLQDISAQTGVDPVAKGHNIGSAFDIMVRELYQMDQAVTHGKAKEA